MAEAMKKKYDAYQGVLVVLFGDSHGAWIFIYFGSCGVAANTLAELRAIYHDLIIFWLRGIRLLVCESDLLCALQFIKNREYLHYLDEED
ncbi:hypothetical protein JHK85_025062 [Glycine max]|nr:hypothetical protein JHK85_025062 [Glycine max]